MANEVENELKALREALQQKTERLNKANDVLRYYSDPRSYSLLKLPTTDKSVFQNVLSEDFTIVKNEPTTFVAGRRAREYFRLYGEETFE